ncbi:MAG: M48 family metallopeptidase [Alphaproteobacteria bacterium]|nr:M48 family metallopeptidase [Alphaproteobacteria bacterium]HPF47452.1 M48 family metalloprotease [Emcibacteraceae bacterium]
MIIRTIKGVLHRLFVVTLIYSFTMTNITFAKERGLSILRDAEIEQIIRDITEPIFKAADLEPNAVETYLLDDSSINAFVMGGQNVFINSGLLLAAQNTNQVIGVIAHETGHIKGGHLSRFSEGMSQMTAYSLMGLLLGVAAMAAGSADAGMAIMMGGQQVGYRTLLRFSRTQESSADQSALTILDKMGQSGKGLIEFFEILGDQDLVPERYQDPYASTHPLTSDRIERVEERVKASPFYDVKTDPELEKEFLRLQAKLYGYIKPLQATLVKYPLSDQSVNARYARTFGYQRSKQIKLALAEIDSLINEFPDNPYFQETKGQILFEDGRVEESLEPYKKAVENLPSSTLIRMSYARSLISTENDTYLDEAISNLEIVLREEPNDSFSWKEASIAYHRKNDEAMTHYSTAQHFLLTGNIRGAMINAKKAVDLLPKNSPNWFKAQDIMMASQTNMDKQERDQQEQEQKEKAERQKERNRS